MSIVAATDNTESALPQHKFALPQFLHVSILRDSMHSDTATALAATDRQLQELAHRVARLQPESDSNAAAEPEVWEPKAVERFHAASLKLIAQCSDNLSIAAALAQSPPQSEQQLQLAQRYGWLRLKLSFVSPYD